MPCDLRGCLCVLAKAKFGRGNKPTKLCGSLNSLDLHCILMAEFSSDSQLYGMQSVRIKALHTAKNMSTSPHKVLATLRETRKPYQNLRLCFVRSQACPRTSQVNASKKVVTIYEPCIQSMLSKQPQAKINIFNLDPSAFSRFAPLPATSSPKLEKGSFAKMQIAQWPEWSRELLCNGPAHCSNRLQPQIFPQCAVSFLPHLWIWLEGIASGIPHEPLQS